MNGWMLALVEDLIALVFIVSAVGVVYFAAVLAERAAKAHRRGMDRVRRARR